MFPTESFPVFCEKATPLGFCNNAQPWKEGMEYNDQHEEEEDEQEDDVDEDDDEEEDDDVDA